MTDETIFASALEKPDPNERAAYVVSACKGDAAQQARVVALLEAHAAAGSFLEKPASAPSPAPAGGSRQANPVNDPTCALPHQPGAEGLGRAGNEALAESLTFLEPSRKPGTLGRMGHYEMLEVLGQGGFGIVFRAFDEVLQRVVAVKVMLPQLAVTSPARKRFLREARTAAAVRHENVVQIHATEEKPLPHLVMEYIPGHTLQALLDQQGPLELDQILPIAVQIARGLEAAHDHGLIHRDIKPANILLEGNRDYRARITDFGLARTVDDASLTASGLVAGTPMYMAPEQARGESLDHRADLFSLGSVLYAMCTGRPPFRAGNTPAVLKRVCDDTPRPIREIIPEVPQAVCEVIGKLHAKDPEDRFQSAKEVADLLSQHWAHRQQPHAVPAPPTPKFERSASSSAASRQGSPDSLDAARRQLLIPAVGLIVTAFVNWIGLFLLILMGAYFRANQTAITPEDPAMDPSAYSEFRFAFAIAIPVLALATSLILLGALKMKDADSYPWAVGASIGALLVGPGSFVGWPMGIWSLFVLSRPEVRALFRRQAQIRQQTRATAPIQPASPALRWTMRAALTTIVGFLVWKCGFTGFLIVSGRASFELDTTTRGVGLVLQRKSGDTIHNQSWSYTTVRAGMYQVQLIPPTGMQIKNVLATRWTPFAGYRYTRVSFPQDLEVAAGDRVVLVPTFVAATTYPIPPKGAIVPLTDAFLPLFNGQDLQGWEPHASNQGRWFVENGILVGKGGVSHLFTRRGDLRDIKLRFQVRANKQAIGGVFFRSTFEAPPGLAGLPSALGYEVTLTEGAELDNTKIYLTGGINPLVNASGKNRMLAGVWTDVELEAVGDQFTVRVNGEVTATASDAKRQFRGGRLALQCWGKNTRFEFRDIRIAAATPARSPAATPTPPWPAPSQALKSEIQLFADFVRGKLSDDKRLELRRNKHWLLGDDENPDDVYKELMSFYLGLPTQVQANFNQRGYQKWSYRSLDEARRQQLVKITALFLEQAQAMGFGGKQPADQTARGLLEKSNVGYATIDHGAGRQSFVWFILTESSPMPISLPLASTGAGNEKTDRDQQHEQLRALRQRPPTPFPQMATNENWEPLFIGGGLGGDQSWMVTGNQPGHWFVSDRVLIGTGGPLPLFTHERAYRDFHLRMEADINVGFEGRVFFRLKKPEWSILRDVFDGYAVSLTAPDTNKPTGALVRGLPQPVHNGKAARLEPGERFILEVIARGNHLVVKVDGQTTTDIRDDTHRYQEGYFGLRLVTTNSLLRVHKMEVLPLPPVAAAKK